MFNLINFAKLCSLLATFVNTQETFQRCLKVVVKVIWRRDVGNCQINVETTLYMSSLKFSTLNNVKSTLSFSALILITLDNVETMLLFSTSSFTTLINVKTTWIDDHQTWSWCSETPSVKTKKDFAFLTGLFLITKLLHIDISSKNKLYSTEDLFSVVSVIFSI